MRFFSIFASLLAASFATGMATPMEVTKRSLTRSSAIEIVNNIRIQIKTSTSNVNQALAGIDSSSSSQAKAEAAQKVNQELNTVISAISQGTNTLFSQAAGGVSQKRAADDDSDALVAAIEAAINELESLLYQGLTALGFSALATSAMQILGVVNIFLFALISFFVPLIGPGLELAAAIIEIVAKFV